MWQNLDFHLGIYASGCTSIIKKIKNQSIHINYVASYSLQLTGLSQ